MKHETDEGGIALTAADELHFKAFQMT